MILYASKIVTICYIDVSVEYTRVLVREVLGNSYVKAPIYMGMNVKCPFPEWALVMVNYPFISKLKQNIIYNLSIVTHRLTHLLLLLCLKGLKTLIPGHLIRKLVYVSVIMTVVSDRWNILLVLRLFCCFYSQLYSEHRKLFFFNHIRQPSQNSCDRLPKTIPRVHTISQL